MSNTEKPPEASFLARWSRRKVAAAPAEAASDMPSALASAAGGRLAVDPHAEGTDGSTSSTGAVAGDEMPETPHPERTLPGASQARQELPSIDSLTHEADFSPFMARDVDPGLRNRAMKKLFTDPHYQFGQMDKLDIYIDDYSKSDPIPLEMLRQMYQAKSLFLFDDEEKASPQLPDESSRVDAPDPATPDRASPSQAAVASPESAEVSKLSAGPAAAAENDPLKTTGLGGPPGGE